MSSLRQLFLSHVGKTSELPLMLEISHAEGMYIYDTQGKAYMDLNSGIAVSALGHRHPQVIEAIKKQCDLHLHTMVYGEHIQAPQVKYAALLTKLLDSHLNAVYYVMTGTETVELAMKLARKHTGRYELISCSGAYHGSTMGSEALRSDYGFSRSFFPGIPGVNHIDFNQEDQLEKITEKTAGIILEPVQAEGGVIPPTNDYLKKVRARCKQTGTLMILDEIQTGFGRTGAFMAHKKYGVTPDVLLLAKAMGGGMPIGALVTSQHIMSSIAKDPALGHITTFGGHPVSCAAALAALEVVAEEGFIAAVNEKEKYFKALLQHEIIAEVRSSGMMMAVELTKRKYLKHVVQHTMEQGAIVDYFLFNQKSFRLAPPLIINMEEIKKACAILLSAMDHARSKYK